MFTIEQIKRLADGTAFLESRMLGETPCKLNKKEREAFAAAKKSGFMYCTPGERCNLENIWFHWCEALSHPYVKVRRRIKYASVAADLIALGKIDDEGEQKATDLWREFGVPRGGYFSVGVYTYHPKISIDRAGEAATRLLDILLLHAVNSDGQRVLSKLGQTDGTSNSL